MRRRSRRGFLAVLEVDADCVRELGKLPTNLLQGVGLVRLRRVDARDREPERWGPTEAEGEGLEENRPLHPLLDDEVDDVNAAEAVERLEDGLVRGEVGQLEVGAGLVEVRVEEFGSAKAALRRELSGVGRKRCMRRVSASPK